jgi:hypothetical protein
MNDIDYNIIEKLLESLYDERERFIPIGYALEMINPQFNHRESDEYRKYATELTYLNLAIRHHSSLGYYKITDFGIEVFRLGGYAKYLELETNRQLEKERKELEAHKANIQASQATVDAAESAKTSKKWGIIGVFISSILAFFSLMLNIYQIKESSIKDDSIKEINKKLKQQDSLLLIQQILQPKIDSLLHQKPLKK